MKTSQRLELQWDARWPRLLSAFVFLIGLLCEVAYAGDTVITFDDVPANTFLDTQFHDRGVDFGLPPYGSLPATSQIPAVSCCVPITRDAPTGHASQVASISDAQSEFWISGMFGSFTTYRQRVQVTVGNTVAADTSSVTLSGFDINGTPVGPRATSMVSGAGAPVTLTVTGSGSTPTIAYFLVQSGDYNKGLWVDDLTYDNPVASAPPDFAFDVQGIVWPGSALHVTQGGSVTKALPLRRFNGSNGDIALSTTGLPPGVTANFAPNPVPGTTTLTNITLIATPNAPAVSNAPFTVVGAPSGSAVGPTARTAQLLTTVDSPAIITTDGAGSTFDLAPCMVLKLDPIYVLKDPSVVKTDLTLALRVFVSPTETADLPDGLHANFDPPVSTQRFNFTLHNLRISYDGGTLRSPITLVVQGTSGTIVSLSQPFTIHPIVGAIDSVTPFSGRIPTRLLAQPGTKVTLNGQGFCPGTKVRFGNVFAEADPDSATPTSITVSVPLLATDGPDSTSTITLVEPNGTQIGSTPPQRFAVDSVRNTAGFSFHNYIPHTTFDQLTAAFGSDQTEDQIPLCWPFDCEISIHDPGAILLLNFLKSFTDVSGSGGACFGIALAAQRFIEGEKPRSDFPPRTASNNFGLDAPDGPSSSLREYINSQNTVQISSEYTHDYLNQSYFNSFGDTSDVLRQIHSMIHDALAAGETPMIALRYGDLFHLKGHIVTAFDIQDVSADPIEYNINVYDPDVEFIKDENSDSGQTHLLNVTKSQIHVAPDGTWTLFSKLPSTEASGFINELIVTRASTIPANPTLLGSLLPSGGGLTIFGTANEAPQTGAPASRVTQLADNLGHTLFTTDGTLNNDRTTRLFATPFAPFGEAPGRGEAFLVAPKNGPVVQTVVGTREATDVHFAAGGGLIARIQTESKPGAVDRIGFDSTGGAVSFLTRESRKPLKLGLMNHVSLGVQSAQIETTTSQGASNELVFDEKRVNVILRHGGPAAPLRMRLSTLAPKGGPSEFDSGPLEIAAGVTATFAPADWTRLSTVTMTTRDSNGSEHREVLQNHLANKPIGHIVKLDVDRLPYDTRSRALDVFSRFETVPSDSQVIITWIVRENGQVVAHEKHAFAASELHHGVRRDRYIFSAPADDEYEVRADLIVRSDDGLISSMHASTKSARFCIGSVKH
jgi:hypothetical protein